MQQHSTQTGARAGAAPAALSAAPPIAAGEWVSARPLRALELLQRVLCFPWLVARSRDLVFTSVRRDLDARFTGTLLGWLWPLVTPVFLFAVYYFIFTKLLAMKLPPEAVAGRETTLGVYMFVGVVVWTSFAEALARCCSSIVENGNLIKKLAFPAELLPLNATLTSLVTMLFGIAVFIAGCLLTDVWAAPSLAGLAWIPLLCLLQTLLAYGFGLALATTNVYLRDTAQVTGLALTVWMFVTPIFWMPELPGIRESIAPYSSWILANPAYHLVYAWRHVLMSAEPAFAFGTPIAHSVGILGIWALAAFVGGYALFIRGERRFADEV